MAFLSGRTSLTTVQTGDIATDAITTALIADDAITTALIAASSVTTAKIAVNNIDSTLTKDALIADYTEVTVATGDSILLGDVNDSGNTKRDTVQGILDLAGGGGAFVLIDSEEASSSSTVTLTGITSTYDMYFISCTDCIVSGDATNIIFRMGDSSGIDTGGSDYAYAIKGVPASSASSSGAAYIALTDNYSIGGVGNATGEGWSASLWLEYSQGTKTPTVWGHVATQQSASPSPHIMRNQGQRNTNIALTQVQFYMSSGTITSGRFSIWGISHA